MTDETAAGFQREGEIAFPSEDTAEETAAAPQAEEENHEDGTQSDEGGDSTRTEKKDVPFDEHPRWQQREREWNDRFNSQETRHQEDLKAIREEFGAARKTNEQSTKIPSWFGGTQEQWDAYRADRDAELKSAQDAAIERVTRERDSASEAEQKAVKEATDFMRSEMSEIEADKDLNPAGVKFDKKTAETLLKTVLDNNLVDTKGRWNYRAGFRIMQGQKPAASAPKPNVEEKKKVAAATAGAGGTGDQPKPTFATSKDFERNRPW
jgi:hypothetical protein